MSKKLAEALMEAGVQHFAAGGMPAGPPVSSQNFAPGTPVVGQANGNLQGLGFANSTNPNQWFGGYQANSGNNVPQTQTVGQGAMENLNIDQNSFVGQGISQWDRMMGMNTYNAQAPGIYQQQFGNQIAGTRAAQTNAYMSQNNLARQLLMQSQGQGPNVAQTQLANATGQNVQQQGALMASQRGANANPALMARQAAMQGGSLQQQAAGQAAALQAQQQLGAQQALQSLYQQQAQNALSAEQVQQQAVANQNNAINTGSLGAQTINANASGQNAQNAGSIQGSLMSSMGSMFGMMHEGGEVPKMSDGGLMPQLVPYQSYQPMEIKMGGGGGEKEGGGLKGMLGGMAHGGLASFLAGGHVPGQAQVAGDSEKNDTVPALLSPGEVVLPRSVMSGSPEQVEQKAIEFLRHLRPQKKGYGGVIDARKGNC